VVSKSGKTAETLAAFNLFKKLLKEKYGKITQAYYVVTDKVTGALRKEVKGINMFRLNSIKTSAGDTASKLRACFPWRWRASTSKGDERCQRAYEHYSNPNVAENQCYQYAAIRRLLNQKHNRTVKFMNIRTAVDVFREWLKQLYGESEARISRNLSVVFAADEDLHSLGSFSRKEARFFSKRC
jgi:glucose-6-phosphate isomerase